MKICLFAHRGDGSRHTKIYVSELERFYDRVVMLTDSSTLEPILWKKWISENDITDISELALVNDSCVLFRKLDDVFNNGRKLACDAWSLTDSSEVVRQSNREPLQDYYHLQSYFLVLNRAVISDFSVFVTGFELKSDISPRVGW